MPLPCFCSWVSEGEGNCVSLGLGGLELFSEVASSHTKLGPSLNFEDNCEVIVLAPAENALPGGEHPKANAGSSKFHLSSVSVLSGRVSSCLVKKEMSSVVT